MDFIALIHLMSNKVMREVFGMVRGGGGGGCRAFTSHFFNYMTLPPNLHSNQPHPFPLDLQMVGEGIMDHRFSLLQLFASSCKLLSCTETQLLPGISDISKSFFMGEGFASHYFIYMYNMPLSANFWISSIPPEGRGIQGHFLITFSCAPQIPRGSPLL
jgi:hypothetical protein